MLATITGSILVPIPLLIAVGAILIVMVVITILGIIYNFKSATQEELEEELADTQSDLDTSEANLRSTMLVGQEMFESMVVNTHNLKAQNRALMEDNSLLVGLLSEKDSTMMDYHRFMTQKGRRNVVGNIEVPPFIPTRPGCDSCHCTDGVCVEGKKSAVNDPLIVNSAA